MGKLAAVLGVFLTLCVVWGTMGQLQNRDEQEDAQATRLALQEDYFANQQQDSQP